MHCQFIAHSTSPGVLTSPVPRVILLHPLPLPLSIPKGSMTKIPRNEPSSILLLYVGKSYSQTWLYIKIMWDLSQVQLPGLPGLLETTVLWKLSHVACPRQTSPCLCCRARLAKPRCRAPVLKRQCWMLVSDSPGDRFQNTCPLSQVILIHPPHLLETVPF